MEAAAVNFFMSEGLLRQVQRPKEAHRPTALKKNHEKRPKAIKGNARRAAPWMFKILGKARRGRGPATTNPPPAARPLKLKLCPQQLAYVPLSPLTRFYKSRTGGILSRLITRTGLTCRACGCLRRAMKLVKEYARPSSPRMTPRTGKIQELLKQYVSKASPPDPKTGRRPPRG